MRSVLPIIAHMGRLCPKGVPFPGFRNMKGWGFHWLKFMKKISSTKIQQTKKCVRSWKKWEVDKNKTEKRKGVNMFLKKERWNICLFKLKQHYGWYCLKKKHFWLQQFTHQCNLLNELVWCWSIMKSNPMGPRKRWMWPLYEDECSKRSVLRFL